jgi:hypothetical protein
MNCITPNYQQPKRNYMNTNYHSKHSIKLLASCAAAVLVASTATSQAALTYNTTVDSTVIIPTSTFTGANASNVFTHVRARFVVAGATDPFDITSITLTSGDGVITSIALGNIQVTGNASYSTNYFALENSPTSVTFANSSLSFVVESTSAANNGATITARLQYADSVDGEGEASVSSIVTVTAVPEPGAISIAALFAAGALLRRNRRSL